jgi:hypothetical protein
MSALTTKRTKFEFRIQDSMKHSQKTELQKKLKRSSRRGKNRKANKSHKKQQTEEKAKKISNSQTQKLPLSQTPPNTLNASSLPYIDIYHISSLNHPISKSSTNFVHILFPIGNEPIKYKPREEGHAMHEIQIRVLQKIYKQVFEQLYTIIMLRLTKQGWIFIKRPFQDNK